MHGCKSSDAHIQVKIRSRCILIVIKCQQKAVKIASSDYSVQISTKAIVKPTDIQNKVMEYWLVAGNGCSARRPSTDITMCLMCHVLLDVWAKKYGYYAHGVSSNTPLHDTRSSGSTKID